MKTPLWKSDVVEEVTGGVSTGSWIATGFSIDSRTIVQGDLFLCLKGPIFDGHDHVREALEKGAVAAIVHHEVDVDIPVVRVGDTFEALKALAIEARRRTKAKLIGVTGSFGKTSTKEALKLVLGHQGKLIASQRSYNNFWGVPLTLCQLPEDYDYGVIEIGMNYPNEITPLSQLVRPDVCLITTVERMHIENCGSYEGVADAKSEIFDGMSRGASAVLKKDNPMFERIEARAKQKGLEVVTFGADPTADARLIDTKIIENRLQVKAVIGSRELDYFVPAVGDHWAYNSLGLLTVVWLLGANVELAAASLSQFQ
ncbi:MAG: UDP-N-acetylmuramoylalanyl-D-glutamyl-2, 6-diaminopimelate--D-alanyl-D-alanine ligase, partial [Alphaproteobacteria bacterium]|nr:UDP-N-acetylmuramoylalanyl-D-glutamyl-2, 6-diaminopimelate--D-alanyl-D-alanine ligase [Alphaproteobacteria bacterium]